MELYRDGKQGSMTVDGGAEVVTGESPRSFSVLNIDSDMLFVGGTPVSTSLTMLTSFRIMGEEVYT